MRAVLLAGLLGAPGAALAHASEGGIILLLPTDLYVAGGVVSVIATVLLILAIPERAARRMFRPVTLGRAPGIGRFSLLTSILSAGLLLWAVIEGFHGAQDPKHNPLPLLVWTGMWVFLFAAQGVFGDVWRWLNPFRGSYGVLRLLGLPRLLRWPGWLGHWPAVLVWVGFSGLLMIDIAPADPDRLAGIVLGYWGLTLAACVTFGPIWLRRGEGISVALGLYAQLTPLRRAGGAVRLGAPGWTLLRGPVPGWSLALLMLIMLGTGSFDGLNETFRWLAAIGVNPLAFEGRSQVITQNTLGLALCVAALVAVYGLAVRAGLWLVGERRFGLAFRMLAPAILPIAFGYHLAHYLPVALVEGQYLADMVSHLLGGPGYHVTTGFLFSPDKVRMIFLSEAGFVVLGHILAILMSHAAALRLTGSHRRAAISQAPLALFMIFYTFFGLWLLASPRGA